MDSLSFYNKNEEIHLLFKQEKVIYRGDIYSMNISINTLTSARFSFDSYSCKINRDILTLTDTLGVSTTFFKKEQKENGVNSKQSWDDYVIYSGSYLSINNEKTFLKLNDVLVPIKEVKKHGIFVDYDTEEGKLRIFKDPTVSPQWKNIYITKM